MGLIKPEVNNVLNVLIGDMFALNRLFDRAVSVLDVKFVMKNTVKEVHPKLAHAFPRLADSLSEYQSSRNELTEYPQTPIGNEQYETVSELFGTLLYSVIKVETNITSAMKMVHMNDDFSTYKFLSDFLAEFNKYTAQMLLINDKVNQYGDTPFGYTQLDDDFDDFMIV